MKINEFAKKYGVDKRTIDYWTNCGLLNPSPCENGYRDYDYVCEREVKLLLIAKALNVGSLNDTVNMLNVMPKEAVDMFVIKRILEEKEKQTALYDKAVDYVNELLRG